MRRHYIQIVTKTNPASVGFVHLVLSIDTDNSVAVIVTWVPLVK